jgi:hypothetical protein
MAAAIGQGTREAEVLERLWGWRTCDSCGGTIMLGEATLASRDGTGHFCLTCAEAPDEPAQEVMWGELLSADRSH